MKKIILTLFSIIVITTLSSCEQEQVVNKYYKTQTVQTGSVNTNISYSSYTEGVTETLLSSKSWWKIISLLKNKWDRVNSWEKLAFLDSDEAKVWYQTSASVISSLNSLKSTISLSYDAQIEAKNQTLKKAENTVKWIETGKENTINTNTSEVQVYENKLQEAEINLEFLKKNLTQTENVLEWKKEQIYKNAVNAITKALILDSSIINFTDELLWITPENKDKNDSFDDYLSAKNSKYLSESSELFSKTNASYLEYKIFYESYVENKDINNEKILEWLKMGKTLAWQFKELLKSIHEVLNNSIENVYLTQTEINAYSQKVYDFWNAIEASLITISWEYPTGLKGSLDSIDILERSSQKELVLLNEQITLWKKQIEIAKTNLDKIKNVNVSSIDSININKETWNINIAEIKAGIESLQKEKLSKLQEINIQIEQAIWNRNMGSVEIWNSEVISPFSWIVTEKLSDVWEVVASWTPIYKISNDDLIKLRVNLNRTIIQNLKYWDSISINIEWIDHSFTWTISNIPNTQDQESKNTEIEIIIDNEKNEIIVWSVAKIFINNSSKSGIIIPNKAIISNFMIPAVMTVKNNITELKNIKILEQNDEFSLIEWLNLNDVIIIEGQENIWDWEELK